jgi:polygalacturonase
MTEINLVFPPDPDGSGGLILTALQNIKESSGGTLRIGKGVWRTGPLELSSHTTVILEEGAVISFIPEPERYTPVWTRWEGIECYAMHPCVFADGQEDIVITGKGTFDGGGQGWWDIAREKKSRPQKAPETPLEERFARLNPGYENHQSGGGGRASQFLRPPLVQFINCAKIKLEGVTLQNSPFWTLHPLYCRDVVISNITVKNPHDAPNTDGMDIDSCEDVLIENCDVSVGDDGIVLKSGSGEDGLRVGKPCRRITVRNCTIGDGHGGIVIGSETAAGIYEVLAEECLFKGTDRGIRIKTRRGRGGAIHDLEFKKLVMEDNLCPLAVNMFYRCGASLEDGFFDQQALAVNAATPSIKNIRISDIKASGCRASAGFIAGLPESPVENVSLSRCEFSVDENSNATPDESDMFLGIPSIKEKSIRLLNIKNIQFNEINVIGPAEAFINR